MVQLNFSHGLDNTLRADTVDQVDAEDSGTGGKMLAACLGATTARSGNAPAARRETIMDRDAIREAVRALRHMDTYRVSAFFFRMRTALCNSWR